MEQIIVAQLNSWVGDLSGNAEKMSQMVRSAPSGSLVVFPELALTGYSARDLLDWDEFRQDTFSISARLETEFVKSGRNVIWGTLGQNGSQLRNRAVGVFRDGSRHQYDKQLLPFYDVFDESRYFENGPELTGLWRTPGGHQIGMSICEDIWSEHKLPHLEKFLDRFHARPMKQGADLGASLLLNLSASPFERNKGLNKERMVGEIAKKFSRPILYVNAVGANDDCILDGGTFWVNPSGDVGFRAPLFQEGLFPVKLDSSPRLRDSYEILDALVLGIRDYFLKSGSAKTVVGMSGGVDSAVVLGLLVRALGPTNVLGVSLPSAITSDLSRRLAREQCQAWGTELREFSIQPMVDAAITTIGVNGLALENMQSRVRGSLLMGISNSENRLLVATGNKSEVTMGYCTLYGDTNGALAPLGDLTKTEVFELAEKLGVLIEIIDRPPTAELRPNQKDSDSLPEYAELDPWVGEFTLGRKNPAVKHADREKIIRTMHRMEFKRQQLPLVLKLSSQAYGPGRRMPLNHMYLQRML